MAKGNRWIGGARPDELNTNEIEESDDERDDCTSDDDPDNDSDVKNGAPGELNSGAINDVIDEGPNTFAEQGASIDTTPTLALVELEEALAEFGFV